MHSFEDYEYSVGGSLDSDAPSYVTRKADQELLNALKDGKFCYVFNSRQMGKSSLRVRAMEELYDRNFACASIDLTRLGSVQTTPEQWYRGIIVELCRAFDLLDGLDQSLSRFADLSPVQQLGLFLEDVLLTKIPNERIVIFIDEIDTVLSLKFLADDFFALIRSCYEQRSIKPIFHRLTFCLLGVATPSDLITDIKRTPFNIGQEIPLDGFQLTESEPLILGLARIAMNPHQLLKEILYWTGGQPFLTQKLCNLILQFSSSIMEGEEAEQVSAIVHSKIIENWESQDVPEHFRTIRNRILNDSNCSTYLLILYRQILSQEEVAADNGLEQVRLRLSGLVLQKNEQLQVYNPIYAAIFQEDWIKSALSSLRPYNESITAWYTSGCADESQLLIGQALQDAVIWSKGKSLSNEDYQFLTSSQRLEQQILQSAWEHEIKAQELKTLEIKSKFDIERQEKQVLSEAYEMASQIKEKSQNKARRIIQLGITTFLALTLSATTILILASFRDINSKLKSDSAKAEFLFQSKLELDALLTSIRTAKQLRELQKWKIIEPETRIRVTMALHEIVNEIREKNRFEIQNSPVQAWRVAFSKDDKLLVSSYDDNKIRTWKSDGTLLGTLTGHSDEVWAVNFSPDNKTLVSGGKDNTVRLWSLDGTLLNTLKGHKSRVVSSIFSPDGQLIASVSDDKQAKVWKRDGNLLETFDAYRLAFSPDSKTIALIGKDRSKLTILNQDKSSVRIDTDHKQSISSIAFSPDGKIIAGSIDKTIRLWQRNGKLLKTLVGHKGRISNIGFSTKRDFLFSGDEDNMAKLWKPDGTPLKTMPDLHNVFVTDITSNSGGKTIATSNYDGIIRIWESSGHSRISLKGHSKATWGVSFSPDSKTLATTSWDKTIRLWKLDGTLLKVISGHTDEVWEINFSPDGQIFATTSSDKTAKLWRVDGTLLTTLKGHMDHVSSVAFSPSKPIVATASPDKTIRLWQIDGTFLGSLKGHTEQINTIKFSPDGRFIATAGADRTIKVWKDDGTLIRTIKAHRASITDLDFSPDSKILASASSDNTVRLWTNNSGNLITILKGHSAFVYGVRFSPDGQYIATASGDRTVKLWNLDGTALATLKGHKGRVFKLAFSPDGKTLASTSDDKTSILWNLDLDRLMNLSCQWLGDYLKTNINLTDEDKRICDDVKPPTARTQ
jgi:WD40 repeat protein